jgi:predicted ATP-grasp superfamily ATP-dependent carboligase
VIEEAADVNRIADEAAYPCVLKAQSAHHWRQGDNWELVGGRKAIEISSKSSLLTEYAAIARAEKRALLQEMVPGGDDCLVIVACYLDRQSRWVAGFNTQKVLQLPEKFGTGCIVKSVSRPELFERTARLLQTMGYSGVAEVEYKWDSVAGEYKLIEINPRPWDQHRLGFAGGIDVIYLAYCEHAGLPLPALGTPRDGYTWIAEDSFAAALLRAMFRGGPSPLAALRKAGGKKIYAIWWLWDPMPSLVYWVTWFIPELVRAGLRTIWTALRHGLLRRTKLQEGFHT